MEHLTHRGKIQRQTNYKKVIVQTKNGDVAMQQIDLNEYNEHFALCGKPITNIGINFDSEKRNIEDWKIK